MKISIRDRVRVWLFGEEMIAIAKIAWQLENLTSAIAQSINHEANILAGISAIQSHQVGHQSVISNLQYLAEKNDKARAEAEAHLDHLLKLIQGDVNRMLLLVEPVAQRGNRPTPAVPDWDHVLAQNLEQFKE